MTVWKVSNVYLNGLPIGNRVARSASPVIDAAGISFAHECAARVAGRSTFFVVDIARTAEGRWILIELNDGQTSGLATIDADEFYRELLGACRNAAAPKIGSGTTFFRLKNCMQK